MYSDLIRETIKDSLTEVQTDEIENILRETIFHSTLDWQTKAQLKRGIKEAYAIYLLLEKDKSLSRLSDS
jgi:hypothetical protein